ncbi:GAF domain nucleotide-binding protein [Metarhizium album ARSEF 1941]|uniref:GAF domain nucleotide-binding protein n=1 Tax=Metarhizium album (strain ARSEF 1941) TaxID=1081103 RepID=A0A0B2WVK6_METAS|nr:GAF domain nucleotide-binding protein [Metarhizium album ARSEF 1941]KHN96935.1 GAF domain nucleotide-binding protein [Metarhizium album ARSEF 1941]
MVRTIAMTRVLTLLTSNHVQVHADASNFADGITKDDAYEHVLMQAEGLFTDQRNWQSRQRRGLVVARLQILAFPEQGSKLGRREAAFVTRDAGFYVLDPSSRKPRLILGPFQGKVACQTIEFGRGVCGAAAATQKTQLIADVDQFPGHIACDGDSKSEIVVPILADTDGSGVKKVVAIIDVDCTVENGFDDLDRKYLGDLADLLGKSCDW